MPSGQKGPVSSEDDSADEPTIEVVESDDDLAAVVEEAMDSEDPIEDDDVDEDPEPVEPLMRRWWKAEDPHLSRVLPEAGFLQKVEVIRSLFIISLLAIIIQIWNMGFGLASSASGSRDRTIDWWDLLFGSSLDSYSAPYLMDPLGWALLLASFTLLISTMPYDAKD